MVEKRGKFRYLRLGYVNPRYNLERWTRVYARWSGGRSINQLGRDHSLSAQAVRRGIRTFQEYVDAGILISPEPIKNEN